MKTTPDEIAAAKEMLRKVAADDLHGHCDALDVLLAALEQAEAKLADVLAIANGALSGRTYDDAEDAVRQLAQVAVTERDNAVALEAKLAESERRAAKLDELFAREDSKRADAERRVERINRRAALAIRQQEEPKPAEPQAQVIDLMQALKDSLKAKPETMEEGK